jgi:hypothetical protein
VILDRWFLQVGRQPLREPIMAAAAPMRRVTPP